MARFSITAMARGQLRLGQGQRLPTMRDLDPVELARSAARKAAHSRAPRELPPGRYTVILEPAAVLDLVGQMFGDFSATAIRDGRSFLNDRIGKKIFGENITIHDDVCAPAASRARPSMAKACRGSRSRWWSAAWCARSPTAGRPPRWPESRPPATAFRCPTSIGEAPANIVIAGGDTPVEEMIAVDRARHPGDAPLVHPRSGSLREDLHRHDARRHVPDRRRPRSSRGVRNFRFNQSLIETAVERGGASAAGARFGRRDVRHGGAGDEGAGFQLHGSDEVLEVQLSAISSQRSAQKPMRLRW